MSKLKIKVTAVSGTSVTLNHVDMPRQLWEIFEQWSEHHHTATLQCMWSFFLQVLADMKKRNPVYASFTDVGVCRELLRESRGTDDTDRSGPEPIKLSSLPLIDEFLPYLETNEKTSSGYVGVYPNGHAWRAMGCRPDGGGGSNSCTLGTFPTPEQASLARLVYYRRHKLLYGRWVSEINKMMRQMMERGQENVTEDDAIDMLNSVRQVTGKASINITEDRCLYVGSPPPAIADDADGSSS